MTGTGKYYLNSYVPLAASPRGRAAAAQFHIPPFVDGSIRREPDLQNEMPAITCLCRRGKFAPRLNVGDTVGYMTVKRRFGAPKPPHRRLTAVLRVEEKLRSHAAAAEWYRDHGYPLPSNCMVPDNLAQPLDHSHRCHRCADTMLDDDLHAEWDRSYLSRSREFGVVLVCRIIHRCLDKPPFVTDSVLKHHFRGIPGTQNPGDLAPEAFRAFIRELLPTAPLSDL